MSYVGLKKGQYINKIKQLKATLENEIAPIPRIFNPRRRIEAETDPVLWLKTYLPKVFFADFSQSQIDFINQCWEAIENRSFKNINAYRGFGKTSIQCGLLLLSHLTGHTKHAVYITAEGSNSTRNASEWFQNALYEDYDCTLEDASPLCQDYPEVYYPIQRRGGVAQRPLKYNGEPCSIVISPERIVFPTIKGSPSSGALIRFTSIGSSSIRGTHHAIRGEGIKRVDIAFLDDVQSDGTAKSETEVSTIVETIKSTVRLLGGRSEEGGKQPLIVLSALTQNQPDDVAVRIIDEMPSFATEIIPFLKSLPSDFAPWRKYKEFRQDTLQRNRKDVIRARAELQNFWRTYQDQLEKDVVPDNPQLKEDWQISAVQYAADIWAEGEKAFWCELQNDAQRAAEVENGLLSPIVVARALRPNKDGQRNLKRYQVPDGTELMTAFIDCGEHYLNYEVVAFGRSYSFAHVVDFGVFPDQNYPVTKKDSYRVDLQEEYKRGDRFDRLGDAVFDCLNLIFDQVYFDETGEPIDVHRETGHRQHAFQMGGRQGNFRFLSVCGVDCSDGEMEFALWQAIDRFHRNESGRFAGRAIPCYGDEATARLMRYYDLKQGEWRRERTEANACDWIENPLRSRRLVRTFPNIYASLLFDANTAKTRRDAAWMTPFERPGNATHFDHPEPLYIDMFASQQCAEEPTETKKQTERYLRWKMKKPKVADNEFLDTDDGGWALANYVGVDFESNIAQTKNNFVKWVKKEEKK